jgi:short-subunit dehydrogenase
MNWLDQVAIITGASEGIGASFARLLSQRGAKLSLIGLGGSGFEDGATENRITLVGDITSAETRRALVDRTLARFGRIDVLVNNAGVGQYGWPSEVDTEISKRMFDINVFSALALTQLVLPGMRERRSGVIVNIGSVGGKVSLPWSVMYCASKWSLHCIDDACRRELQPYGISVVKVCPGIVDTKFRDHVLAGKAPTPVQDIRRVVTPDHVAERAIRGIERNKRTIYAPRIGWVFTALEVVAPWAMDLYLQSKT